jgi:hypothetical protein
LTPPAPPGLDRDARKSRFSVETPVRENSGARAMAGRTFKRRVLVCFVMLAAVTAGHPPTHSSAATGSSFVSRINQLRAAVHMRKLPIGDQLAEIAAQHSRQMASDSELTQPIIDLPGRYLLVVETGTSVDQILDRLMRNSKKRNRVLAATPNRLGAAVVSDGAGIRWATIILRDGPEGVRIPYTIPADCSREATKLINQWMASVPDGSALVFGWKGCYRTERTLRLRDRVGLTLHGNGATFRRLSLSPPRLRYPHSNRHWLIRGGGQISITNMRVKGTNTVSDTGRPGFGTYRLDFEFEHGFSIHGVQGIIITNVSTDATWGDGLYFAGGDQYARGPATNVYVSDVTIDRNGRQAIALSNIDGGLFERVNMLHSRRAGFDLEPPPGNVRNIEIRDSYVNSHLHAFSSAGRGDVSNIEIHHNVVDGYSVPWVYVKETYGLRRHDWSIHDNQVLRLQGSPMPMLYFVRVDNVAVEHNVSRAQTTQSRKAVSFTEAGGTLLVADNDFTGACWDYVADPLTEPVTAYGNILSPPETCP